MIRVFFFTLIFGILTSCQDAENNATNQPMKNSSPIANTYLTKATLAGGCFWCVEAVYEQIPGVTKVVSGYIGGSDKPTYEAVSRGLTPHAEAVQLTFDPQIISYTKLLEWFWELHDPTQLNRQGNDVGTQYRSAIFYHDQKQQQIATKSKNSIQANFSKPVVTQIVEATEFFVAESYHQDYYKLNKNRNPYCRIIITPKLKELGLPH